MLALIVFIATLSVLIFIHELGHFLAARKFGVKVEEFGFGLPPRIFGKKIGETLFSLNWIPFGGFVRIYGEDYLEKGIKSERALCNKPKHVRALVAAAGVFGNFLLAIVCFSIVYSFTGIPTETDKVIIEAVANNSPAEQAGLLPDQRIVSIDGKPVGLTRDFIDHVKDKQGKEILVGAVGKEGGEKEYRLSPRENPPEGEGAIGVAITNVEMVFYPIWQMPFRGAWFGVKEAVGWGMMIVSGFAAMIIGLFYGEVPQVAGPVGIYQITADVVRQSWLLTLQFVGVLSINLMILNLLPFPALDGGRLLFIAIETVVRKRIKPQIEQYVHMIGMVFLLSLMLLVTFNDVRKIAIKNEFIEEITGKVMEEVR